jgi:hypothetical protein
VAQRKKVRGQKSVNLIGKARRYRSNAKHPHWQAAGLGALSATTFLAPTLGRGKGFGSAQAYGRSVSSTINSYAIARGVIARPKAGSGKKAYAKHFAKNYGAFVAGGVAASVPLMYPAARETVNIVKHARRVGAI